MKSGLFVAVSVLVLAACSGTPTVQEVADAAGNGSVALVKEANGSAGALVGTSTATTLGQLVDHASQTGVTPSLQWLPLPVTQAALRTQPAKLISGVTTVTVPTTSDVDAQADALGKFFRERIFTQANLESSSSDGLVFRIKGEDVCGDGVTPDPTCEASFDRYEVRIRVTRALVGFAFYLELGPKKLEPVRFELASDRVGVGVNLSALKGSLEYLDQASGEQHYLPKTMEGAFTVRLQKNGDQDFTLTSSVDQAIKLELDGAQPASFSTEAKDPWVELHVQGKDKALAAKLDLGVTDLSFPYSPNISASGQAGKTVSVHLAGASASADLSERSLTVDLKNIGLGNGESFVTLDGTRLLTVNLNPDAGRHFDVSVGMSVAGPTVRVSPELDLTTTFFYQPLLVDTDVSVPAYGVDSTYHFLFNGGSPTLVPNSSGFKVTSGTLRLENTAHADQAVVVGTGQCLVKVTPADGADPLLGQYAEQDCP